MPKIFISVKRPDGAQNTPRLFGDVENILDFMRFPCYTLYCRLAFANPKIVPKQKDMCHFGIGVTAV